MQPSFLESLMQTVVIPAVSSLNRCFQHFGKVFLSTPASHSSTKELRLNLEACCRSFFTYGYFLLLCLHRIRQLPTSHALK